jgi:predicted ferric reductase
MVGGAMSTAATSSPESTTLPGRRARPASGRAGRPASQDVREGTVLFALALGAIAVISLWWVDTPTGSIHTLGDRLTAAGRITGLVGTYLIVVEVLLMARIPWLDRRIGPDRLTVWHRNNGAYAVGLLAAHALLILWGYSRTDHTSVVHETTTVVLSYPDVLMATVALLLLVAVGIMSARAARARMRYETWYFLHLYTYLAIALSFSHQLATGSEFATHPLSRAFWVALFVVVGANLGVYRVGVPLRDAFRYRLRVRSVVSEGPDTISVYVVGRGIERMRAESGQFFRWRFLNRDCWWQAHPYSLSAAPNGSFLRFTARVVGDHGAELRRLAPGTRVVAEGPYGAFTASRRSCTKLLLIAGGVGVTPLRALLETVTGGPGEVTLLYRGSEAPDLVLRSELDALAKWRGAVVHYLLGPRDQQPDPLDRAVLAHLVPDIASHDAFICGPPGMIDKTTASLRSLGLRRSQIHSERYDF